MSSFQYSAGRPDPGPLSFNLRDTDQARLPSFNSTLTLEVTHLLKGRSDLKSFRATLARASDDSIVTAVMENLLILNTWPHDHDLRRHPFLQASVELCERASRIPGRPEFDRVNEKAIRKLNELTAEAKLSGLEARCGMKLGDLGYYKCTTSTDREALAVYQKALPAFEKFYGLNDAILHSVSNLVDLYLKREYFDEAAEYCEKALKVMERAPTSDNVKIYVGALKVCGATYRAVGEHGQAEDCYLRILEIADLIPRNSNRAVADAYFRLSSCKDFFGNVDDAFEFASRALSTIDGASIRELETKEGNVLSSRDKADLRLLARILKRYADSVCAVDFPEEDAIPHLERSLKVLAQIGDSKTQLYKDVSRRIEKGTEGDDSDTWGNFDGWQKDFDPDHFD
jgi:tetratricopeptide (TPR) repeat protein